MVDIDVSFLLELDASLFSASQMELGPNAGKITWANALGACDLISLTPEEILEAKDYIRTWGAWEDEEIDGWPDNETKALIIQSAAGDYREIESVAWDDTNWCIDWDEYEKEAHRGSVSGNLFMSDGKLYLSFCT
jgi:hypothetical protein